MSFDCKHCDDTGEVYSEDGEGPWMCPWCSSPFQNLDFQLLPANLIDSLEPYFKSKEKQLLEEDEARRVKTIVDLLFPSYDKRLEEDQAPIRHPGEKSWWWNSAKVIEYRMTKAAVYVSLQSYVAGGNYDEWETSFPLEWMSIENPAQTVQEWCIEEHERLNRKYREQATQELQGIMADAREKLKKLDQ